jgi:hypothetical protein
LNLRQPERRFGADGENRVGGVLCEDRDGKGEKGKNRGELSAGFARTLYFRNHYVFN